MRERAIERQQAKKKSFKSQSKKSKRTDDDVSELPEVDQNTKKMVTQRSVSKSAKVKGH